MTDEKKKIISSILNGRRHVEYYYDKYTKVKEKLKVEYDVELNAELKENLRNFIINLCNYVNAIIEKKDFFENVSELERIFNEKIPSVTWKDYKCGCTLRRLLKDYRNTNQHFDKYDSDATYSLFESSVSVDKMLDLYKECDFIVFGELKKVTIDDIPGIILANSETISAFHGIIQKMMMSNECEKDNNKSLYDLNKNTIFELSKIDFVSLDEAQLEDICLSLFNYLKNPTYKEEFIKRYGEKYYEDLLLLCDDDSSIDDYNKRVHDFINKIMLIEKNITNK